MSLEDLLKNLRQDYLKALPDKMKQIQLQIEQNQLETVRDSFHKLRGTGKTYGLPAISELSEIVENICLDRPQNYKAAALMGLDMLRDIHRDTNSGKTFDLSADPRLPLLRKLLPS